MPEYSLKITENDFVTDDGERLKLFGVKAFDDAGNILADCPSICESREKVEALSVLIIENNVSICHIKDIIEDMF